MIKEVSEQHVLERKSFESKMKQEYKLKKERWKREMAEVDTPKRQREAVLSQHKENFKEIDATENQRLARNQKEVLDREVRKFRRRRLVKYHELEQDLLREVRKTDFWWGFLLLLIFVDKNIKTYFFNTYQCLQIPVLVN